MGIRIGIDVGGSTTKIVGIEGCNIISPLKVKATDPLTSTFGAFGKFTSENNLSMDSIDKIIITGVGSSYIKNKLYGIKTYKVDEFIAIGLGGLKLSGLKKAIIVSMGTGTAIVNAAENGIEHIGGTGIGGGTLVGLAELMINMRNFDNIIELASEGDLSKIDLTVGDISKGRITSLPEQTTAANFGKISDLATKSDISLGIVNLFFETIGMLSMFASRIYGGSDIVLTGNLTIVPEAHRIFKHLNELFGVNFIIPDIAEFSTAIGAALSSENDSNIVAL